MPKIQTLNWALNEILVTLDKLSNVYSNSSIGGWSLFPNPG
jgi:hypothetical protein